MFKLLWLKNLLLLLKLKMVLKLLVLTVQIDDERHLCLYVKDVIDDPDGYDGLVFNRWYADMCRQGIPIDWHEFI